MRRILTIRVEKDSNIWIAPAEVCMQIMNESACIAHYTYDRPIHCGHAAGRAGHVEAWDACLAVFLVEESRFPILQQRTSGSLPVWALRMVIHRMPNDFQTDGILHLSRGSIELIGIKLLEAIPQ